MTLQEKFRKVLKNHFQKNKEEASLLSLINEDNEKIADDFAIGFAEWLFEHYNIISCYDKRELLEIYKKEKGL